MPQMPFDDLEQQEGLDPLTGLPGQGPPALNDDILTLLLQEHLPGVGTYEMGEDGEMREVSPEDDYMPAESSDEFGANLALSMEEQALTKISSDLLDQIDEDIESRNPWRDRFRRGFEQLGLTQSEMDDGPFPGACSAVMPLLSEAIVQFWARALGELVPSEGPVKGSTRGKASKANNARARRVAEYMNHELMFLDRSWYADTSRLLFALPYTGSCFKKVYRDHDLGRNSSVYVQAEDFICNYAFTDLDSAPRYTHRIWRTPDEIKRAQVARVYRKVDLVEPGQEDLPEETEIKIDASDFEMGAGDKSARYELYEAHCYLTIPGDEHPEGLARPYTVTIERGSGKVLAIYRGWREQDPLERRRICFVKYDYLPGPGFYGYGLLHMIGGLQDAATGALRAILDGAATASLQGGFMSQDAAIKDQQLIIEPGVWKKINGTAEDFGKSFFTPPFKEPSPVLFQVMGYLVQRAEKFAATTEMQTGAENSKNMPVGSTLAMIEQGGKVFSTIHRGLHKTLGEELRMRFDLVQEYKPVEGYPYDVEGAHEGILAEDFAPGVSVVPVSDPNIFSQAQRIALNQAVYDLAMQNPDIIQRPVAVRRVMEGLNVPDIEELLVVNNPPAPMDPVSQVQALLRGEPVQAYPDQDHVAHIQHLAAFAANEQYGANPQIAQQIGPAVSALLGQHLAYAWATHARALGAPIQLLPPVIGPPEGEEQQGMPPQQMLPPPQQVPPQGQLQGPPMDMGAMGGQGMGDPAMGGMMGGQPPQMPVPPPQDGSAPPELIAQIAAQIAPQMAKVPGLPVPPSPQDAKAEMDMALKQKQLEQKDREISVKEQDSQAGQAMKSAELNAKLQTENVKQAAEMAKAERAQHEAEAAAAKAQASRERAQREAEQASMRAFTDAGAVRRSEEKHQADIMHLQSKAETERTLAKIKSAIGASKAEQDQRLADEDAMVRHEVALRNQEVNAEVKRKSASKPAKKAKGP
jgi:hypothetical protein